MYKRTTALLLALVMVIALIVPVNAASITITSDLTDVDAAVNVAAPLQLQANASNGAALSYQWYSCTNASGSGASKISGATSATYTAPPPPGAPAIIIVSSAPTAWVARTPRARRPAAPIWRSTPSPASSSG